MRRLDIHDTVDSLCERLLARRLRLEIDCSWEYFPRNNPYYAGTYAFVAAYDHEAHIHLDKHLLECPWVPLYFLRDLVWHETVHLWRFEESDDLDAEHSSVFELAACLIPGRLKAESWYRSNRERLDRHLEKVRRNHRFACAC